MVAPAPRRRLAAVGRQLRPTLSARPAAAAGDEERRAIPIITYHRVGGAMDPNAVGGVDQGRVELSEFERQMAHLAEAGVAVVTHAEIVEWLRGGASSPAPSHHPHHLIDVIGQESARRPRSAASPWTSTTTG